MKPVHSALLVAAILLAAASSRAGYEIPAWAITQSGGTVSQGRYRLMFSAGQPSPAGAGEAEAYTLGSGLVPAVLDAVPPMLLHSPPGLVSEGTDLTIAAEITDQRSDLDTAIVYFRKGGALSFQERPMARAAGDTFTASIPGAAVTERGLAYYIKAADSRGNASFLPPGAPDSLLGIRVGFTELESVTLLPGGEYRMISLPGSTGAPIDTILVDDFGPYDPGTWRLGRWAGAESCSVDCYVEYPALEDMLPGKGFWIISGEPRGFDFSGVSLDPTRPFDLNLEPGWNQIGTPFAFTTDWLTADLVYLDQTYEVGVEYVTGQDTIYVEDNLIAYDGAYSGMQSELEPWSGYWIYSAGNVPVDLRLRPGPGAGALERVTHRLPGALFEVAVASDGVRQAIQAGLHRRASDGWDPLDHRRPPEIEDSVRPVFVRPDWGRRSGRYMTDVVAGTARGATWRFSIEGPEDRSCHLDVDTLNDLPAGWSLHVYDLGAGLRLTGEDLPIALRSPGSGEFLLAAGSDDYLRQVEESPGLELRAQVIAVMPNPSAGSTTVGFFLPDRRQVSAGIYSVEGRLVRTLARAPFPAGLSSVTWQGDSEGGGRAAPGVYFLKFEAGPTTVVRKVVRVR
jgi:hypothetical protein